MSYGNPDEFEEAPTFIPEASITQVFNAADQLSEITNDPVNTQARASVIRELNKRPKVSAEKLNEQYKGKGVNFTDDTSALAAALIVDGAEERQFYQDQIDRAPDTWFAGSVVPFIATQLGALSGIDVATNVVLGGVGSAAKAAGYGVKGILAAEFAGNVVENSIAEAFVMDASEDLLLDYTAADFAMNVTLGSAIGVGLSRGLGAIFDKVGGKWNDANAKLVEAQIDNNIRPNVDAPLRNLNEDVTLDGMTTQAVEANFGKNFIKESDDLIDVFDRIKADPNIDDVAIKKFSDDLKSGGIDERKFQYLLDEPERVPELSSDNIADIKKYHDDPTNRATYDAESVSKVEAVPKEVLTKEASALKLEEEFDPDINALKKLKEAGELDEITIREFDELSEIISKDTERVELQDNYTKCKLGKM